MSYPFAGADAELGTMTEKVLVTGGFGLVGSQTVRRLVDDGHRVIATDLGTPAQRKAATSLPAGAEAHWADLTDQREVDRLVAEVSPTVIVHLAAVILPPIYRHPQLGASRQRRRDRGAAARRGVKRTSAALRVGFQQRGLRVPQSASSPRPAARRLPAAAGGPLRRPQGGGRKPAPGFESGVGDPAPRRGDQRRARRDAVHRRRACSSKARCRPTGASTPSTSGTSRPRSPPRRRPTSSGETLLIAGDDSHLLRQKDVGLALAAATGAVGRPARRSSRRSRQRRKLVCHRLVGHHPRTAGVVVPAPLVAGHARRDARHRRMAALSDVLGRPRRCGSSSNAKPRIGMRRAATPIRGVRFDPGSANLGPTVATRQPVESRYASRSFSHTSLIVGKHGTACHSRSTGTWPATAMVAECSSSETPGPTNVTPSR